MDLPSLSISNYFGSTIMNDNLAITLFATAIISIFGSIFYFSNEESKRNDAAVQALVQQGTPALEAACAVKGI